MTTRRSLYIRIKDNYKFHSVSKIVQDTINSSTSPPLVISSDLAQRAGWQAVLTCEKKTQRRPRQSDRNRMEPSAVIRQPPERRVLYLSIARRHTIFTPAPIGALPKERPEFLMPGAGVFTPGPRGQAPEPPPEGQRMAVMAKIFSEFLICME